MRKVFGIVLCLCLLGADVFATSRETVASEAPHIQESLRRATFLRERNATVTCMPGRGEVVCVMEFPEGKRYSRKELNSIAGFVSYAAHRLSDHVQSDYTLQAVANGGPVCNVSYNHEFDMITPQYFYLR